MFRKSATMIPSLTHLNDLKRCRLLYYKHQFIASFIDDREVLAPFLFFGD